MRGQTREKCRYVWRWVHMRGQTREKVPVRVAMGAHAWTNTRKWFATHVQPILRAWLYAYAAN